MNKNILVSMITLLAIVITGCSDQFLQDKKSYDKYDESIFTNQIETGWYVDRIYADFFSGYKSPTQALVGSYTDEKTKMTEEMGGTIADWINPQKALIDAANCPTYYGTSLGASASNNPYTRIRNCNFLLEKINTVGQSLSLDFRNKAKGQMFFLRALQYYDLMRTYGGVPIVTATQTASATDETIKLPRATIAETVVQISKDLDSAAVLLPAKWNESTDYGRMTRGAALAVKSRVTLTAASPLFNTDWDNPANQRWVDALNAGLAAETMLTTDGYGLYGTTSKDWAGMFLVDNKFCSEAIIVQLCSSNATSAINNGWEKGIRLASQGGTGGVSAPKEMIDLFPMADGSRPTLDNSYDDTKFFMNRDPRFYRTFAFSGCKWGTKANASSTIWTYRYLKADAKTPVYSDNNQVSSPAVVRKMSNPAADNTAFDFSSTDIFEYRYAELLLNIAECYAATNNIPKCIEYLGKIRNRVGILPGTNNYGIGTLADKYAAIAASLYERQVELAYEGKRFWDIQRWMLYNDDATSGNNTCAKLGLKPLNGTTRTGNYWQSITNSDKDPIPAASKAVIVIDPDASDFQTQLTSLSTLFSTYFTRVATDTPMDKIGTTPVTIAWKQNYYLFGLPNATLTSNPWLLQTKGWNDAFGVTGTYDFQK